MRRTIVDFGPTLSWSTRYIVLSGPMRRSEAPRLRPGCDGGSGRVTAVAPGRLTTGNVAASSVLRARYVDPPQDTIRYSDPSVVGCGYEPSIAEYCSCWPAHSACTGGSARSTVPRSVNVVPPSRLDQQRRDVMTGLVKPTLLLAQK